MKYIPNAVSRKVSMTVLKGQKNSPALLFAAGVVGVGTTVVLACRATLKLEDVLEEGQNKIDKAKGLEHAMYSERDRTQDVAVIYTQTAFEIVKLYAPSIVVGVASIGCLTQSHRILSSRNVALTAAYKAVEKGFLDYRQRVVDEYGEEKDREFRYGTEIQTVNEKTESGIKKRSVKLVGADGASIYAQMFDITNRNWQDTPQYNAIFLRAQQMYANQRLMANGYLLLNDVYDALGFERTKEGCVVGWLWRKGTGDDYVDFGLRDWPDGDDFVHGREGAILLDFNVDGLVYDQI